MLVSLSSHWSAKTSDEAPPGCSTRSRDGPRPRGGERPAEFVRWEGLLAPGGFAISSGTDAPAILQTLADQQAELLDEVGADRDDLIVASLVEAETAPGESPENRAKIA